MRRRRRRCRERAACTRGCWPPRGIIPDVCQRVWGCKIGGWKDLLAAAAASRIAYGVGGTHNASAFRSRLSRRSMLLVGARDALFLVIEPSFARARSRGGSGFAVAGGECVGGREGGGGGSGSSSDHFLVVVAGRACERRRELDERARRVAGWGWGVGECHLSTVTLRRRAVGCCALAACWSVDRLTNFKRRVEDCIGASSSDMVGGMVAGLGELPGLSRDRERISYAMR
jgi:hypothetical protein